MHRYLVLTGALDISLFRPLSNGWTSDKTHGGLLTAVIFAPTRLIGVSLGGRIVVSISFAVKE
jgi:hypothetical protein